MQEYNFTEGGKMPENEHRTFEQVLDDYKKFKTRQKKVTFGDIVRMIIAVCVSIVVLLFGLLIVIISMAFATAIIWIPCLTIYLLCK